MQTSHRRTHFGQNDSKQQRAESFVDPKTEARYMVHNDYHSRPKGQTLSQPIRAPCMEEKAVAISPFTAYSPSQLLIRHDDVKRGSDMLISISDEHFPLHLTEL